MRATRATTSGGDRGASASYVATLFPPVDDGAERGAGADAGAVGESPAVGFLADRPQSDWARILDYVEMRRFAADEVLVTAGEPDCSLIVLMEGAIGVRLSDAAGTFTVIHAPSVFGEMAFLDGGPRSATLVAVTSGEYLRLPTERFEMLRASDPELGYAIVHDLARILARRLRHANDVIARGGT